MEYRHLHRDWGLVIFKSIEQLKIVTKVNLCINERISFYIVEISA